MLRIRLLLLLCFSLLLASCYEDVEGCLDVNAANYDLDADIPCPDGCCEFPTLSIAVRHLHGGIAFDQDSFYLDGAGQAYRLNSLRYYWSDLRILTSESETVEPESELDIALVPTLGDTVFGIQNDNLTLVELGNTTSREVGNFRTESSVTGLLLLLGVEDTLQRAAPSTAPSGHPLAFQEGRLHFGLDTGYVQFKLEYDLVQGMDTLALEVNAFGNQEFFLDFGGATLLPRGFDLGVTVETDVDLLLNGLDLSTEESVLAAEIAGRFPFVFRIVAE